MISLVCPEPRLQSAAERVFYEALRALSSSVFASESEGQERVRVSSAADLKDVRQSCQGDSEAFRRLVERHQAQVGRILWRFNRDRHVHEELVQDVFVEAYLSLRDFQGKAPFAHWLARIATRVGYRYWKRTARQRNTERFSLEQWDLTAAQAPEQIDASHAGELLYRLMAQLPPRDRLILTLRYLDGCSVAETAQRTGWTKTMVKVQSLRARKKLERLFRQTGMEST